jgi:hypothetical protein
MKKAFFVVISSFFFQLNVFGQESVVFASRFIATLSDPQKAETIFPFDVEERYNFHFVPMKRRGITFNEMSNEQNSLALELLKSCLGEDSFKKTREIMQLEVVLKELENRKPEDNYRDPGNYHFTIFGNPSANSIWGWRFEGHHISFNFSFNRKMLVSGTPGFMGSNPAIVLNGPMAGKQVLKDESDKGFSLIQSLNEMQLKKAIIDTVAFKDILTFDKRKALIGEPEGIKYSELSKVQQSLMLQLIRVYLHRYRHDFAEKMMMDIQKEGLDNIWFAWAGYTRPEIGKGSYYRVQGPTLVIEYDNTQNNANHVHSVIRDLKNDFGGDILLDHYKKGHSH